MSIVNRTVQFYSAVLQEEISVEIEAQVSYGHNYDTPHGSSPEGFRVDSYEIVDWSTEEGYKPKKEELESVLFKVELDQEIEKLEF